MTKQLKLPIYGFIAAISSSMMLAGCIIHVGANDGNGGYHYELDSGDHSSTNKSVRVREGREAGDVSSVNGSLRIEDSVTADDVSNVNGRISIGDKVTVDSVESVNGSIRIGSDFTADSGIEAVNGDISIENDSRIKASIETVNGDIKLNGVSVDKDLITINGDITLAAGTVVEGDVRFEGKPRNNSWKQNTPTLRVDKSSSIKGMIIIEKDVEFEFEDASLLEKVKRI